MHDFVKIFLWCYSGPMRFLTLFFYMLMIIGVFTFPICAQERGDDSFEWIHTDQSTWYKPKHIRLKWEKDAKEERIIVPVKGLEVNREPFPVQLLCDYSFDSRLDQFVFPDITQSKLVRFIHNVGFIGEIESRFKIYLNPNVGYDLSYAINPDRVIVHLFLLPVTALRPSPNYFIQSKEVYLKKDTRPVLLQLGMETEHKDIDRLRMRELNSQVRAYPIDLERYYLWIGPFDTSANARAARPKFYKFYNSKKEDEELSAFKQYLTYHLRPTQETGYDVKSLREEFLKSYREKNRNKLTYEDLYYSLSERSEIVEY